MIRKGLSAALPFIHFPWRGETELAKELLLLVLNIHLIFNVSGFMICLLEKFFSFSNGNTMVAEAMVLKADFGYLGIAKLVNLKCRWRCHPIWTGGLWILAQKYLCFFGDRACIGQMLLGSRSVCLELTTLLMSCFFYFHSEIILLSC